MPQIYLHGWYLRGHPFLHAVKKAKEYGYDGMEAFSGHYPKPDDPLSSQKEMKRIADSEGLPLRVAALNTDLLTDDDKQRRENLARIVDYVGAIGNAGFKLMNGYIGRLLAANGSWHESGSKMAKEVHFDRAIEACKSIAAAAEKSGVTVALEVHMVMLHDTAKSTLRILNAVNSPRLVANLDPGNMRGYDHAETPEEAVNILGNKFAYAHLKNVRRFDGRADYHYTLWGGDLDYRLIIRHMHRQGFRGPYCIEYSGAGDRTKQAREDLLYLKDILAAAESGEGGLPQTGLSERDPVL